MNKTMTENFRYVRVLIDGKAPRARKLDRHFVDLDRRGPVGVPLAEYERAAREVAKAFRDVTALVLTSDLITVETYDDAVVMETYHPFHVSNERLPLK